MFPSPWYLWNITYGARMGRPMSLCQQSSECKLCKWRLFHHCQSNNYGPDLLPLKVEEKVIHMKVILSLRRLTYFLQIFMGFFLEQSQHECLECSQTPGPGSNEPAERWGLSHLHFGVPAHRALLTTVYFSLLWETQWDLEGHGARLALCLPAFGGGGVWCRCFTREPTSSVGWAWLPACSEGSPQVSLIQVSW